MSLGRAAGLPLVVSIALHAGILGLAGRSGPSDTLRGQIAANHTLHSSNIDVSIAPPRSSNVISQAHHPTLPQRTGSENAAAQVIQAGFADTLDGSAALDSYATHIRERIGKCLQYPLSLQRRGIEGRVRLKLTLDTQGRVQAREITERASGAGTDALDALALAAVREAEPFPEPPAGLGQDGTIVLNLPVDFRLGHR